MSKLVWLIFAVTISFSSCVLADDEEVDRSPIYHVYENIDLIPTTQLEYDRPRIVIKAIVPKLVDNNANDEEINNNVENYNNFVLDLISEEADAFREQVKANEEYQQSMEKSDIKNDFIIDFDSSFLKSGKQSILSLRFAIHGIISGLSRSYRKHRVLNYNLATGEPIELPELFLPDSNYLSVITQNARIILIKKLRNKSKIDTGTMASLDNYQNWNLTPNGLRITFDQNQVAPSIYGAQTITIPYAALSDVINPESLLGKCLKHKRHCFGNRVMTGGFIDEARNRHALPSCQRKLASGSLRSQG